MKWWVYLDQIVDTPQAPGPDAEPAASGIAADIDALRLANALLIEASAALLDMVRADREARRTSLRALTLVDDGAH